MMGFVIVIHVIVCIFLATIILMQSGRGGGLTEGFQAAESVFGAKTNVVLVRGTAVLATMFLVACLSLAFLSSRKDRSLMADKVSVQVPAKDPIKSAEAPAAADLTGSVETTAEQVVAPTTEVMPEPAASEIPATPQL